MSVNFLLVPVGREDLPGVLLEFSAGSYHAYVVDVHGENLAEIHVATLSEALNTVASMVSDIPASDWELQ